MPRKLDTLAIFLKAPCLPENSTSMACLANGIQDSRANTDCTRQLRTCLCKHLSFAEHTSASRFFYTSFRLANT